MIGQFSLNGIGDKVSYGKEGFVTLRGIVFREPHKETAKALKEPLCRLKVESNYVPFNLPPGVFRNTTNLYENLS